ncbi:MAG TPA: hypothetical protein VJV78_00035 [Polyangiales bacterium]|nr:hypothetical protein [Polyangiales bacterium]
MPISNERLRELLLALLVLVISSYAWMFSKVSVPNERTRAYLTVALVDHGTIAIDQSLRRFGAVYDLASFGGHYYTDKAPGSSLLAVPIYGFVRLFSPAEAWDIVSLCNLFRTYLMLPFGLLGFVLLRSLLRGLGISDAGRDVASLAFSLGSPMLHYSNAFYGHVLVATLVLGALRCLRAAEGGKLGWFAAAGGCAGLAGLVEYQAIVLAALLGMPILFQPLRRILPGALAYLAGGLPFALALLWYDARAFGGPFELSYQHLVASTLQELHGFGLAGATSPTREVLYEMATSPSRGLFCTAPLLGFGLCALPFVHRRLGWSLWLTCLLGSAYFVLIVASSSVWFGGWSFGLRLLIPIYGMLAIAAAAGFDACARWSMFSALLRALAIYAIVYQLLVLLSFPELPPEFFRPLPDAIIPALREGLVAPNLACKHFGLSPWNLAPIALVAAAAIGWLALCGEATSRVVRAARGGGSVLLAGLALLMLSRQEPLLAAGSQARWLRQLRSWSTVELRCAAISE